MIPGFTSNICKLKWLSFKKIKIEEYNWTEEET